MTYLFDILNAAVPSHQDPIRQSEYMGYLLSAPESFWAAGPDIISEVTNGCGTAGIVDYLVPDQLYFLSILAACKIHDWTFAVWDDKPGFALANDLFRNNMQRIVQQYFERTWMNIFNRIVRDLRMNLSIVYYQAVKNLGERFYYDSPYKISRSELWELSVYRSKMTLITGEATRGRLAVIVIIMSAELGLKATRNGEGICTDAKSSALSRAGSTGLILTMCVINMSIRALWKRSSRPQHGGRYNHAA